MLDQILLFACVCSALTFWPPEFLINKAKGVGGLDLWRLFPT
jgi:hypothetical protein